MSDFRYGYGGDIQRAVSRRRDSYPVRRLVCVVGDWVGSPRTACLESSAARVAGTKCRGDCGDVTMTNRTADRRTRRYVDNDVIRTTAEQNRQPRGKRESINREQRSSLCSYFGRLLTDIGQESSRRARLSIGQTSRRASAMFVPVGNCRCDTIILAGVHPYCVFIIESAQQRTAVRPSGRDDRASSHRARAP